MAPAFVCPTFTSHNPCNLSPSHVCRRILVNKPVHNRAFPQYSSDPFYRGVTVPLRACLREQSPTDNLKNTAIIVVDHGSKRKAANDMIFKIADDIQARTPSTIPVFAAHMELAEPTIADAVKQCAQNHVEHVIIVPFFLSPGRHATEDIPQLTREAVDPYPAMTYDVRPPIGTHPSIIDVVLDRAGLL